jgi:hypothetical protein
MLEEMIGDRHHVLTPQFFQEVSPTRRKFPDQHFSFKRRPARMTKPSAQNDNFQTDAWTCVLDRQFFEFGVSGT